MKVFWGPRTQTDTSSILSSHKTQICDYRPITLSRQWPVLDRPWTSYYTKSRGTSHLCDCAELLQRPAVNLRQSNWPLPFAQSGLVNASTTFAFIGRGNSCWRYGNISGMKCSERRVRANWSGSTQEWARPISERAPGLGNTATIRGGENCIRTWRHAGTAAATAAATAAFS